MYIRTSPQYSFKQLGKLLFVFAALAISSTTYGRPEPIKDANGNIRYIVDLVEDDDGIPLNFGSKESFIASKKNKASQMVDDVIKFRGVTLVNTTSLVGTSFTAHLTDEQVERFSKDKRVRLITQDAYLESSTTPPWTNSANYYGEWTPWGVQALGVAGAGATTGLATVYVLDNGVELHSDLPGLSANNRLTAIATTTDTHQPVNPTGCYSHATHVAGIIGASINFSGTVGVLPGVRIVSIAMGEVNQSPCPGVPYPTSGSAMPTASSLNSALDKVYELVTQSQQTGVVNLSFNLAANTFSSTGTVGQKMHVVATGATFFPSGFVYPGALIVQSAGNDNSDACAYAYNAPDPNDGILVVGGIDANGQRVVPMNGSNGFRASPGGRDAPGSNFGSCVEVWAPSQRIFSTWTTGGFGFLSGTSMAAPHIAGLAARLLENNGGNLNSQALEAAVRAHLTTIYASGLGMPRLYAVSETAVPTVEIVEGLDDPVTSSSMMFGVNFNKLAADVNLRFQAIGADACTLSVTRNNSYYSWQNMPTASTIATGTLPAGQYVWTVTCTNSFFGTTNTATASGTIRKQVTADWWAMTTSTKDANGTWQWKSINNFDTVSWAYIPPFTDDPFDQQYFSENAVYCRVESFAFTGYPNGDQNGGSLNNPNYTPTLPYVETLLWYSGPTYPTSFVFATLNFRDPHNSPYGIAPPPGNPPYDGYKWRLTCTDAYTTAVRVMYGIKAP